MTPFFEILDPELLEEIKEWRQGILNFTDRVLGETRVHLQGSPRGNLVCRQEECNLGNLITDSFVWYFVTNFDESEWNDISNNNNNNNNIIICRFL